MLLFGLRSSMNACRPPICALPAYTSQVPFSLTKLSMKQLKPTVCYHRMNTSGRAMIKYIELRRRTHLNCILHANQIFKFHKRIANTHVLHLVSLQYFTTHETKCNATSIHLPCGLV